MIDYKIFCVYLGLVAVTSCTNNNNNILKYDTETYGDEGKLGLQYYLTQDTLRVCMEEWDRESEPVSQEIVKTHVRNAILTWVDVLRPIAKFELPTKVEFSNEDCQNYPLTIRHHLFTQHPTALAFVGFKGGRHNFMLVNSRDNQRVRQSIKQYSLYLHEIGHVFGLGDTYAQVGCEDGQPNSLMCDGLTTLHCDDIVGARNLFKKLYPGLYKEEYRDECVDVDGAGRVDWKSSPYLYGIDYDPFHFLSGVKIRNVEANLAAGLAGLQKGDIVKRVDGEVTNTELEIFRLVENSDDGVLNISVEREGNDDSVDLIVAGDPSPTDRVALIRYHSTQPFDHWVTSKMPGISYSREFTLGYVSNKKLTGTVPLFSLFFAEKNDHRLAVTINAEETNSIIDTVGWIFTDKKEGTKPIFLCLIDSSGIKEHFVSLDEDCESSQTVSRLGYIFENLR